MKQSPEELQRRIDALQERVSKLCGAVLRVSSHLDLDTVLREVLEAARDLTQARRGVITAGEDASLPRKFLSSGITPGEHQRLIEWAEGPRLFEHFRSLPGAVRVAHLPTYLRSLGFSTDLLPYKTLQGTPMLHRGVYVGSFFLADKEGGEFNSEDEEALMLFASQAATAITNARTYRDEQRTRANLEALIETSPVGVAVFDAITGDLLSLNREAKRIAESVRMPGYPPEQLLEVLTCRRADGQEFTLGQLPLSEQLSNAQPVRAEEIVLSVPDGRSVTTLVNATPIRGAEGEIVSVVVTMQDLAPLEELERLRAEFLEMVSHELRAPLTSIKGSTAMVLGRRAFTPVELLQFFRLIDQQVDHMTGLIGDLLDVGQIETGTLSVSPEPSDVGALVEEARTTFLAGGGRHTVLIDLPPELPWVMADRQRTVQTLNNLLSNAGRHAPESSTIHVAVERDGVYVAISVSDQGRGIAPDHLAHLFRKYSGADKGEHGVGGGLGLAICKGLVEAQGGRIWATSGGAGQGARFTFTVPVAESSDTEAVAADSARGRAGAVLHGREQARILVVDDDPQALVYVRDALTDAGYSALVTPEHEELARIIRVERPHLVLLDLILPGTDGIELMERVAELAELPVIFISAYGRDETIARALEAGAVDYIVKPFSPTELVARIRAALRRRVEPEPFVLGELAIHYEQRQVTVAGQPVELTTTEYELLRTLSLNAGRVLTYEALLRQAWSRRDRRYGDPKLVHSVVRRLRRKLGDDAARPVYIHNARGVGYRMPGPGDL